MEEEGGKRPGLGSETTFVFYNVAGLRRSNTMQRRRCASRRSLRRALHDASRLLHLPMELKCGCCALSADASIVRVVLQVNRNSLNPNYQGGRRLRKVPAHTSASRPASQLGIGRTCLKSAELLLHEQQQQLVLVTRLSGGAQQSERRRSFLRFFSVNRTVRRLNLTI